MSKVLRGSQRVRNSNKWDLWFSINEDVDMNVTHRISANCAIWRQINVVLCDRGVSITLNGKSCRAVVRSASDAALVPVKKR